MSWSSLSWSSLSFLSWVRVARRLPCAGRAISELATHRCRIETEQGAGPALPLVYVIENNATDQLVFLFRPSTTNFDYVLNFAFNEVHRL